MNLTVLIIAILVLLFCALLLGAYFVDKYVACPNSAKELKLNYKYNFFAESSCFVEMKNGEWISLENYQGVNLSK